MKPKVFIGSSGKAHKYAKAIHAALKDAECTTWDSGAFELSGTTIGSLMNLVHQSDFGVFVFAADDQLTIRGEVFHATRDNVIYELGLFTGYLMPERCFIAIPQTVNIRIPNDLDGLTYGRYEDDREDGKAREAVVGFCSEVEERISALGLFKGNATDQLTELTRKFESLEEVTVGAQGVSQIQEVIKKIEAFCLANSPNKRRLLTSQTGGSYIALLCSISAHPETTDLQLICKMRPDILIGGVSHYKLLDTVDFLEHGHYFDAAQARELAGWLKRLPGTDSTIARRIRNFTAAQI